MCHGNNQPPILSKFYFHPLTFSRMVPVDSFPVGGLARKDCSLDIILLCVLTNALVEEISCIEMDNVYQHCMQWQCQHPPRCFRNLRIAVAYFGIRLTSLGEETDASLNVSSPSSSCPAPIMRSMGRSTNPLCSTSSRMRITFLQSCKKCDDAKAS